MDSSLDSSGVMDLEQFMAPTLLLLDTDTRTSRLLATLLRADGYFVETCTTGAAALARAALPPVPEALLIDLTPARSRDIETVRKIHTQHPELTIIVITAHPQLARPLGAEPQARLRIFIKPLDYPALVRALAERHPS